MALARRCSEAWSAWAASQRARAWLRSAVRVSGGGELTGGELLGFPGLCQGGLAGSGVAVSFFENLDADFKIAQGLACAGDLISVALQGTGRRFDTGAVLFGAAAGGGFSSFCLVEIFP